eukprot:scaffold99874_cov41-Tisochrysis_lutea.AAC.1
MARHLLEILLHILVRVLVPFRSSEVRFAQQHVEMGYSIYRIVPVCAPALRAHAFEHRLLNRTTQLTRHPRSLVPQITHDQRRIQLMLVRKRPKLEESVKHHADASGVCHR